MYARFATSPIGTALSVIDSGLTLTTHANSSLAQLARSTLAHEQGQHGAEFTFGGDAALVATLGIVASTAPVTAEVGSQQGIGWRLHSGEILMNGEVMATGIPVIAKGDTVGIHIIIGNPSIITFYHGDTLIAATHIALVGALHFAASLESLEADGLKCIVNAGQWQGLSPAITAGGWMSAEHKIEPIRLASEDYLSSASDTPSNTAWQGIISDEGISQMASVSFWPWATESRTGTAQLRVQDANGQLDLLALGDVSGTPVAINQVMQGDPLSTATAIGRYVLDKIDSEDDGIKALVLRDAHDDLDNSLSMAVFLPSINDTLAWQEQPVIIGAVRSVPGISVNSDGSVQWLADSSIAAVESVLDRGAAIAANTGYTLQRGQQLAFSSPPLGPVLADVSTIGEGMQPASLRQALTAIFSRIGKHAWSSDDASAIDIATGYAGIGYYADDAATARQALASILPNYSADWWQDGAGVLRLTRLIDPESIADNALDFELDWRELAEDLVVTPDLAPNLSRRMAYQPNAAVLDPGDMITDQVLLPSIKRQALSSGYRGQVYAAGSLATRYRHAETAEPFVSQFDRKADAQTEIDRIIALYAIPRHFYAGTLVARTDLQFRPGQVGRITYHRYGLHAGRKVLITGVISNPITGAHTLKMWGG